MTFSIIQQILVTLLAAHAQVMAVANPNLPPPFYALSYQLLSSQGTQKVTKSFEEFKGRPVIVVNTACKCGLTNENFDGFKYVSNSISKSFYVFYFLQIKHYQRNMIIFRYSFINQFKFNQGCYQSQGRSQVYKKGGQKRAHVFVDQLKYKLNYP